MKKQGLFIGIFSILLVFGLFMTGCGKSLRYTVTFWYEDSRNDYYNDYDNDYRILEEVVVSAGKKVTRPEDPPTRNGYSFVGWYESRYDNQPYDFNSPVYNDLNLYAMSSKVLEEGIHIRIISFAGEANYLDYSSGPTRLDQNGSGRDALRSSLNSYSIASQGGTALFYSVHEALADLKANENRYPANLELVSIITFTDGLDNGSIGLSMINPIESRSFSATDVYANYVNGEIRTRKIANKPITAYSVGVMGDDVEDETKFTSDLAKIASPNESYVFDDFAQVQGIFENIANGLNLASGVSYTMTTTMLAPNTRVRMTFDVDGTNSANADASSRYIEGTINLTGTGQDVVYTLNNITYTGGLSSDASTGPITATRVGTELRFVFPNTLGFDPSTDLPVIKQWTRASGASTWQYNSEYRAEGATNYNRRSAIIYLVLDSSRSLSDDQINQIRTAARNFITSLHNRYWDD
jgi:uncharacterized repeat protein (TIGR02543 family)